MTMNYSLPASQDASSIPVGMLGLLLSALGPGATGQVIARWMLSMDSSDREHVLLAYHEVFDAGLSASAPAGTIR
jgi:hypothetical protein